MRPWWALRALRTVSGMTNGTTGWLLGRVGPGTNLPGTRLPGTNLDVRWAPVPAIGLERAALHASVRELQGTIAVAEEAWSERLRRLWAIGLLNAADVLTTFLVLLAGGREANPVMGPMLGMWWVPVVVKSAVFVAVWSAARNCPANSPRVDRVLQGAIVFFGAVVSWNLLVLAFVIH